VFKVAVDATKLEVKKAVEKLFKVTVESVQTVNVKGKVKRNKFGLSAKPSWKKAYVRLASGQDIDFALID
jgi:large subunit ribosomal protein L23